jgi:NAD(P)H-flavin reductase
MADSQTFLAAGNTQRPYTAAVPARGNLLFDWQIVNDLADRLGKPGCGLNRELKTVAAIREIIHKLNYKEVIPDIPEPSPLDDIKALPATYRGHKLSELVCALQSLNRKTGECVKDSIKNAAPDAFTAPAKTSTNGTGFLITYKQEVVPNTHIVTVHAPTIAGKCLPGQFVIAMVHENSERIPYTVADWDKEKGTVTLNILETGRSSRELALLKQGDYLKHFAGPLGSPIEVKKYGTVVLGGGCFGVGGILPLARALKAAGNRVICIEEASSAYLLYWQKELQANSDEFMIATKDGSVGVHGGVQEVITRLVNRGEKIDQAFIIGCTFMMMKVSETTKQHGIPTQTALNPIMLDGTGMCGACRVTVDGTMKFACVDGPFLDGHKIDWVELLQRRSAYKQEEIIALPQEPVQAVHKNGDDDHYHEHKCLSI